MDYHVFTAVGNCCDCVCCGSDLHVATGEQEKSCVFLCGCGCDLCRSRAVSFTDMMKDMYLSPMPVPQDAKRRKRFEDMVRDGIVGKSCLTAERLFGLTAESFLPGANGLCPTEDAFIGFSSKDVRYANVYEHVRETEARLWSFLHDGKRVEKLLLWEKDDVLAAQLASLNRGFMQKKTAGKGDAVLISGRMSIPAEDYDVLWRFVQKGGTILFFDVVPTDARFYDALFSEEKEEKSLLWDTYLKKEMQGGGCLLLIKTKAQACRVLKAALDDALRGNVWIEDTYPVCCPVRYLHKKVNGKNIYLFYNDDEEARACQYVRLPYSTRIVAVDPKSGGTWLPEQQRYEAETWFKLWLAPEESLLYIEDGAELPLLYTEDYPKKASWENLVGEARISGYGAMPAYCFQKGSKAELLQSRSWENYRLSVTVSHGDGTILLGFGEASLLISEKELCYTLGKKTVSVPICFSSPAKRLYITMTATEFSVMADGVVCLSEKAPRGRVFCVQSNGTFLLNSLCAVKIN